MADNKAMLVKVSNGVQIPLPAELVVGRQAECDLQLTEGHASRRHAKVMLGSDGVWVEDLGSANGTFVNGVQITGRVHLQSGDRLRFDVEEFDLRIPSAAKPVDEGKTMFRAPDAGASVEAESSGLYKRPGAWADPDAQGDAGNKTKFIDPAQLKQMMDAPPASGIIAASGVDGPHLHVVSGSRAGLNIRMTVGESGLHEWTIGSQADREVQFQDSGVSALHAKIVNEGARWRVLDQMSANGTFVNGKRSNVSYLTSGDRLRFGPVECIFQLTRGAGTSGRAAEAGSAPGKSRVLLGVVAFVVTIAVLFALYKFVLS
jgi:pSer/pThr/pTyr-binding forkhead associated (FHA) protein